MSDGHTDSLRFRETGVWGGRGPTEQCKVCGSMAINPHRHGRDKADLDHCDVCYWRKRAKKARKQVKDLKAALEAAKGER